jgi:hypothetical protein
MTTLPSCAIVNHCETDLVIDDEALIEWSKYVLANSNDSMECNIAAKMFGISKTNIARLEKSYDARNNKKGWVSVMDAFVTMLQQYYPIKKRLEDIAQITYVESARLYNDSLNLLIQHIGYDFLDTDIDNLKTSTKENLSISAAQHLYDVRQHITSNFTQFPFKDKMHRLDRLMLCRVTSRNMANKIFRAVCESIKLLTSAGLDPCEGQRWNVIGLASVSVTKRRIRFHEEIKRREQHEKDTRYRRLCDQLQQENTMALYDPDEMQSLLEEDETERMAKDPFLRASFPGFDPVEIDDMHVCVRQYKRRKVHQYLDDMLEREQEIPTHIPDFVNPLTDCIPTSVYKFIVFDISSVFDEAVDEICSARQSARKFH